MRLTKDGIRDHEPSDEDVNPSTVRPDRASTLLGYWHRTLQELEDGYTLGDLISLLRDVGDLAVLSPLLACDIEAFVAEADQPRGADDETPLEYMLVHNLIEPQRYEPDPSQPDDHIEWMDDEEASEYDRIEEGVSMLTGEPKPCKIVDATSDDPIAGTPARRRLRVPTMHGRWTAPHCVHREFSGWGTWPEPYAGYFAEHPEIDPLQYRGAFALDFTPLSRLLHLPLRYDSAAVFRSSPALGEQETVYETELTITFGEFLHAVFWELGFYGTPDGRDEVRCIVNERAAAVRPTDANPPSRVGDEDEPPPHQ